MKNFLENDSLKQKKEKVKSKIKISDQEQPRSNQRAIGSFSSLGEILNFMRELRMAASGASAPARNYLDFNGDGNVG